MASLVWNNGISVNECESIITQYKDLKSEAGEAGEKLGNTSQRTSQIYWIREHNTLTRALFQFLLEANDNKFRYNVFSYTQNMEHDTVQFTKYSEGDFYHWHTDSTPDITATDRKISLTLNLSDPESYEGGDLEFFRGDSEPEHLNKREQGSVVCFDSYEWHRVTPVTRGTRYSLVLWLWGPAFI